MDEEDRGPLPNLLEPDRYSTVLERHPVLDRRKTD